MKDANQVDFSNPLKKIWNENGCAIGGWVLGTDPVMAEATALAGFDWICIDMQHGWIGLETLPKLIQSVALAGAVPIVRVPANEIPEHLRRRRCRRPLPVHPHRRAPGLVCRC